MSMSEEASSGSGATNVDTPGPIENDGTGGQSGRSCCRIVRECDQHIFTVGMLIALVVHSVKLGLVTTEMLKLGTDRATFSEIVQGGHFTLKHVLLENWDASWETTPYPPSHGDFAVYTIDDVESGINYAVSRYYNAEKQAAGLYKRMTNDSMEAIITYFDLPNSQDESQHITIHERHFPIEHGLTENRTGNATIYSYSITDELEFLNLSHAMERMLFTTLKFTLYSFRRSLKKGRPYCLRIRGKVTFEDTDINGQVHVNLSTRTHKIECIDMGLSIADARPHGTSIDIVVYFFCSISIFLAVLNSGFFEYQEFRKRQNVQRTCTDVCGRLDEDLTRCPCRKYVRRVKVSIKRVWKRHKVHVGNIYVLISDAVTIYGTCKLNNESNAGDLSELDYGAVFLGTGCILIWLDSFRYFKIIERIVENKNLKLLYKVLCRALPDVICYMICAGVIFIGFCFCGFVVLGPYHTKFSTLSSSATALFALANADELYATFYMFDEDKPGDVGVWWFSRVYLTVYICIYIFVVVNVLIGMFTSAYEVIREHYEDAKPLNKALQEFIMHPTSTQLRRCLYEILDSGKFTSDNAEDLKRRLNVFIEENDGHQQNPDSNSETSLKTI